MFGIGVGELLLILLIVLLLFGSTKLPELSRSIGEALKELRAGLKEGDITATETTSKTKSKKKSDVG
jgi:sec-independent protein translocase protein TatA